ncbi:hypothetical protein ONZ45_g14165 [Pleurotus djamor]|nr:hypothetical protein ONZ45_g14165 [Pleurotus djamor]
MTPTEQPGHSSLEPLSAEQVLFTNPLVQYFSLGGSELDHKAARDVMTQNKFPPAPALSYHSRYSGIDIGPRGEVVAALWWVLSRDQAVPAPRTLSNSPSSESSWLWPRILLSYNQGLPKPKLSSFTSYDFWFAGRTAETYKLVGSDAPGYDEILRGLTIRHDRNPYEVSNALNLTIEATFRRMNPAAGCDKEHYDSYT